MFDPRIPVAAIYIYTLPTSIFLGDVGVLCPLLLDIAGPLAAGGVSLGVGLVAVGRVAAVRHRRRSGWWGRAWARHCGWMWAHLDWLGLLDPEDRDTPPER